MPTWGRRRLRWPALRGVGVCRWGRFPPEWRSQQQGRHAGPADHLLEDFLMGIYLVVSYWEEPRVGWRGEGRCEGTLRQCRPACELGQGVDLPDAYQLQINSLFLLHVSPPLGIMPPPRHAILPWTSPSLAVRVCARHAHASFTITLTSLCVMRRIKLSRNCNPQSHML